MRKKRTTLLTCLLVFSIMTNTFGLSLIDKMEYSHEVFDRYDAEVFEEDINFNFKGEAVVNDRTWNGYELVDDYKYLSNSDFLHEFDEEYEYKRTLKRSEFYDLNIYEAKYLELLESENDRYIKSGFSSLPDLHISLIDNDDQYFNQLENKISKEISCVPTAATMYLHLIGFNNLEPDDISKDVSFYSNGSYTDDVLSVVSKHYRLPSRTYNNNISLEEIKKSIFDGYPVMTFIDSGYIDYGHIEAGETYSNRRSRLYKVRGRSAGFYSHAILFTGFIDIEGETFLEVYDPWTLNNVWADGKPTPSGKGRYIKYEDYKKMSNGPLVTFTAEERTA